MINSFINNLSAKLRNVFSVSEFVKRSSKNDSSNKTNSNVEKIQVKTAYGRTLELNEAFPYGFVAKARKGKVLLLANGGNFDSVEILPVSSIEYAPELKEGDVAIYTEGGAKIVLHEDEICLNGDADGGLIKIKELKKELEKNNQILQTILNVCNSQVPEPGNGTPSAFQQALNIALIGKQTGDFSNIENEKVKHG